MVKEYGAELAPEMVLRRCVALHQLGDIPGAIVWKGVLRAVKEIVRTKRRVGEPVN
jgi:hypothetical protein